MRKPALLVVLAFAGLALVAASGTAAAETGDAGTASVDASMQENICAINMCECPNTRACLGTLRGQATLDAGTGDDDCLVRGCGCPDPRICGAGQLEATALDRSTANDLSSACMTRECVEQCDSPCLGTGEPRLAPTGTAESVDTFCIPDWCSCRIPCLGVQASVGRTAA